MADVNASEEKQKTEGDGFISSIPVFIFWLAIGSVLLWNWDGFWQTDIKFLIEAQRDYFPEKYNEEQLKTTRVTGNNKVIDDISSRFYRYEEKLNAKIEEVRSERDKAIDELDRSKETLSNYLEEENTKCRYFDTSLRMIDHLTKKYTKDELNSMLSCTSSECEKILHDRSEVKEICG